MGGKDKKFSSCLYLELINGNDETILIDDAKKNFNEAEIGVYQLISTLTKIPVNDFYFFEVKSIKSIS